MTIPSYTNDKIRDSAILYSISIYLREGETAEQMINKFKGDIVKTIQFLRERYFETIEKEERESKPIMKEKMVNKKIRGNPKHPSQEKLF